MYTKEELISQIKDKTIKRYLRENTKGERFIYPSRGDNYSSHENLIIDSFNWDMPAQGWEFWNAIHDHFYDFENGKTYEVKTYEDFKHLDKSIK